MNEVFNSCPEFDPFCSPDWRLSICRSPRFFRYMGVSFPVNWSSQLESEIRLRIQYKRSQIIHDGFNKKCVELFNLYKPDVNINICVKEYEPSAYYRLCYDMWCGSYPTIPFIT